MLALLGFSPIDEDGAPLDTSFRWLRNLQARPPPLAPCKGVERANPGFRSTPRQTNEKPDFLVVRGLGAQWDRDHVAWQQCSNHELGMGPKSNRQIKIKRITLVGGTWFDCGCKWFDSRSWRGFLSAQSKANADRLGEIAQS